jgi:hypothetical protein
MAHALWATARGARHPDKVGAMLGGTAIPHAADLAYMDYAPRQLAR